MAKSKTIQTSPNEATNNKMECNSSVVCITFCLLPFLHYIVFSVTSSISLGVYLITLSPSIVGGDSGELVAEGCQLGTSHPPGYPMYTILVHLVTKIGAKLFGNTNLSPAFFVNLMSACFGALTSGFISASVFLLTNDCGFGGKYPSTYQVTQAASTKEAGIYIEAFTSVMVGLLYAFSPLAWQYSTTAEVFALHGFFVSIIIYSAIFFSMRKTCNMIFIGSFLCGLALTNQHTVILLEVPLILWVFCTTKMYRDGKVFAKTFVAFVAGLSCYITLPIFALLYPHAGSWGDVLSVQGFLDHIRRKDYGSTQLYSGDDEGSEDVIKRSFLWLQDFTFSQAGNIFALFFFTTGCFALLHRAHFSNKIKLENKWNTSGIGQMLFCSLLFYLSVFHWLANLPLRNKLFFGIHQRFWLHPNILSFIFMGVGISKAGCSLHRFRVNFEWRTMIISIYLLVSVYLSYSKNIFVSDQSTNMYFDGYARGILNALPQNSLLFINYDQQWTSIRYLQECEGVRKDVTSINLSMMSYGWWSKKRDLYPKITFPGTHYTSENSKSRRNGGFTFSEIVRANYEPFGGNVFIGGSLNFPDLKYQKQYMEIPFGMSRRIMNKVDIKNVEKYRLISLEAWKVVTKYAKLPDERKYSEETWEWTINREFFTHLVSRSTFLLDIAVQNANNKDKDRPVLKSLFEAAAWLELASINDKVYSNTATLKKNLGLAYLHIVRSKENNTAFPLVEDIFSNVSENFTGSGDEVFWSSREKLEWKLWASTKWGEAWGEFLTMDKAMHDEGYEGVKKLYENVMGK